MHPVVDLIGPGAKQRACGGGGPQPQQTAMHAWGTRAGAGDSLSGAGGRGDFAAPRIGASFVYFSFRSGNPSDT